MSSPISLPVAKLRALGCKVSTLFGHDPNIGSWKYGVTLPGRGIGAREFTDIDQDADAGVAVRVAPDGRVLYSLVLYRPGQPLPDKAAREAAEKRLAARLDSAAGYLSDRKAAR
jgi:hypothetical protein